MLNNWFWQASDGRIYSSARRAIVQADDSQLIQWQAINGTPPPWPKDADGKQTDDALNELLQFYGLPPFSLTAYAAEKRWEVETSGVTVNIGDEQLLMSTARGDDRTNLNSTYAAIRDGLREDGATFKFVEGPRSVSNADMATAILTALAHVQSAFDVELAVVADIEAGKITRTEEIDAFAWPGSVA
jgi:hypothetical protein